MKKARSKIVVLLSILFITLFLAACGKQQELSFGREAFFGVKTAETMGFAAAGERPVQAAAGKDCVWILTMGPGGGGLYVQGVTANAVQSLSWQQEDHEMIMGISGAEHLYAAVACGETVQVRKLSGEGQGETILTIPQTEAPEQVQPTVFFADSSENAYFAAGNEILRYSPEDGRRTAYKIKGKVAFLQEKEPGAVEALTGSGREIALYSLSEDGDAEEKWRLPLPTTQLGTIGTADPDTLILAVDGKLLFVDNETGEIGAHFNSMEAGVSSGLLGGLLLPEEGALYLVEQAGTAGGVWEELAAQSGPEGDRTVLVYGTVSLNATMQERITAFNKSNPDYYITVTEYTGENILDQRLQMQAAVTSGRGPDILDLSSYCVKNYTDYAKSGYLEDLEPFLLAEGLDDDLLRAIHELYRVDGKLCMAVPHFMLWGLALNPEYVSEAEREDWSYQTLTETAARNVEALPANKEGTGSGLLSLLLTGMQNEFIDYDEKKAYFDTPEFISLLEFCREYGKKKLTGYSEDATEALMVRFSLMAPVDYLSTHIWYGEESALYGYPAAEGQLLLVESIADACGISALSEHKEGAWEFIKTLYTEDYQKDITGYSHGWAVRKSCWYALWDEAKSGANINGVQAAPATEDEIERFMNMLLSGKVTANLLNYVVMDLILEEADPYFAGDYTAEEIARNIQSRVMLMLSE